MPYIKEGDRKFAYDDPASLGELNYCITSRILKYLDNINQAGMRASYTDYNNIIGVLECAKLEFYRRMVAEYEDQKLRENGDVFPTV